MLCPSANSAHGRFGKVGGLQDAGRENAPIGYIPSFALWSGYHPSCDRERKGAPQGAANRWSIVGKPCRRPADLEDVKASDNRSEDKRQRDWKLVSRNLDMC